LKNATTSKALKNNIAQYFRLEYTNIISIFPNTVITSINLIIGRETLGIVFKWGILGNKLFTRWQKSLCEWCQIRWNLSEEIHKAMPSQLSDRALSFKGVVTRQHPSKRNPLVPGSSPGGPTRKANPHKA